MIRTVTGDVEAINGRILAHEHLQIDLSAQKGPANKIGAAEEDAVVEDLRAAKEFGLAAITDLSAPGWGRDPVALRRISERSGVHVVCAAGYYWDPFPDIALTSSIEQIRDAMIAEVESGTDGTNVRCGVIKVGTAQEPNEPAERLFKAAALASRATGAPVITHTSNTGQAAWHVRVLEGAGMDMSHAVISHMGAAKDISELVEVGPLRGIHGNRQSELPQGTDQCRACRPCACCLRQGAGAPAYPLLRHRPPHHALPVRWQRLSHGAAGFRADADGARHSGGDHRIDTVRQSGEDAHFREVSGD